MVDRVIGKCFFPMNMKTKPPRMATNHITPIMVTVRLNAIIFGYFKGLTVDTRRFRVKRKILPVVVAAATQFITFVKIL